MRWNFRTRSVLTVQLMLAMTFSLAACQSTPTTLTAATKILAASQAVQTEASVARDACRAWPPTPYSSRDTAETQLSNRANNAARSAYCDD